MGATTTGWGLIRAAGLPTLVAIGSGHTTDDGNCLIQTILPDNELCVQSASCLDALQYIDHVSGRYTQCVKT